MLTLYGRCVLYIIAGCYIPLNLTVFFLSPHTKSKTTLNNNKKRLVVPVIVIDVSFISLFSSN
jgi:hypothetical protein